MRTGKTRWGWLGGLLLAGLLPAMAAGGDASVPGPGGLIHACYVKSGKKAGQLRVTDPPAIAACKQTENSLDWPSRAWQLGGNAGTSPGVDYLGTSDDAALELKVNGGRALRLEPAASPNLIGGSGANSVTAGSVGAAIAGGGDSTTPNSVTDNFGTVAGGLGNRAGDAAGSVSNRAYAFVGGGQSNTANGFASTVGGGYANLASGGRATIAGGDSNTTSNDYATVGGGVRNAASGLRATVGGGADNAATGQYAIVGGGEFNEASGYAATIPGGGFNTASGDGSFAAGFDAQAIDLGAFVWADTRGFDFASTSVDQFNIRATGVTGSGQPAVRVVTGITGGGVPNAGVQLFPGASSWSMISDRAMKERFAAVDGRWILERLAGIPILTWNYRSQPASIRHMGPMAQDFYAAFGLGEDRRLISTVDADGVALAAIQGLYRLAQAKDATISRLEAENAALAARVARLERLVRNALARR